LSTPPSFLTVSPAEWAAVGPFPDGPADIYGSLSHLLRRNLERRGSDRTPYLVGIAGAVSVGKSTTAGVLQGLLAGPPHHLDVALVSTDGFLYPNAELEARGLTARKGSPESYDVAGLVRFLTELKSGRREVSAPVYSHLTYDVVAGAEQRLHSPDVVILEGVNVLDTSVGLPPFAADLLDYSVYLDAEESDIERWYVQRFLQLSMEGRDDAGSFYHHFAAMSASQIERLASRVWRDVNGPNLRVSVLPTRGRADLILEKGPDHAVRRIRVRTP
jgi:type I pantothenate kinase